METTKFVGKSLGRAMLGIAHRLGLDAHLEAADGHPRNHATWGEVVRITIAAGEDQVREIEREAGRLCAPSC